MAKEKADREERERQAAAVLAAEAKERAERERAASPTVSNPMTSKSRQGSGVEIDVGDISNVSSITSSSFGGTRSPSGANKPAKEKESSCCCIIA